MKFLSYFLLFFLSIFHVSSLISLDLHSWSPKDQKMDKYLLSLKFVQKSLNFPSFLQEIPLHQQVIAQRRLSTFYGEIGIGGKDNPKDIQTFKMLFDTGSCELWVPGEKCETDRCKTHQRYTKSPSFEEIKGGKVSIQYLSGGIHGETGRDIVHFGDLAINNQTIGIANEVQIPLLDEVVWDGIVGLAYPNHNMLRKKIKPVFDNAMSQGLLKSKGEKNQFAYYLGHDRGAISFGGADMRFKRDISEEFQWAPIAEELYWTINLSGFRSEGQVKEESKQLCAGSCKSIVDTGTYLIYGPPDQIRSVLSDLNLEDCKKKKELPDIVFEFEGEKKKDGSKKTVTVKLTPDDYVLEFKVDNENQCVIGIAPDNEDTGWTFGQVFLKAYYTVFDRDNGRIGFARSNPNPYPEPGFGQLAPIQLPQSKDSVSNETLSKRFSAKNSLNMMKEFDNVLRGNQRNKEVRFSSDEDEIPNKKN